MKLRYADRRHGIFSARAVFALAAAVFIPLLVYAGAPSWWGQRGVLIENATADHYAPANQGQLKNIAKAAVAEMDEKLVGGAGDQLHTLINSWSPPSAATNDFAPLNLGQLKTVARPFYDRQIVAGLVEFYPWLSSLNPSDDFAIANIGQVKKLFAFAVPPTNQTNAELGDRLASGEIAGSLALQPQTIWVWADRLPGGFLRRGKPERVNGLSEVSSVSVGERHWAVLHNDGTVATWGDNSSGQLGDGTNTNRDTPAAVPNLASIKSIKAGGLHTVALQQDGSVLAWGDNYYGQLGTGDTTASSTPRPISGLDNVRKIAASYGRSVALRNDGTVWIWGYDHYAWQIGQDISNNVPTQVAGLTDVIDIAVGYEHVVALKSDGTVWAWGSNYANQIGNGASVNAFIASPVQVPNLANVVKIASNWDHSLALLNDGTVWAWGYNDFGQLGDGTTQARQRPFRMNGLSDVIAIATNYSYSLAMKADGTVWTWGTGGAGALPGADLRVPQQVVFGLLDTNANGMDDRWENQYFGDLSHAGNDDSDGDGISNLQEYLQHTDPTDYYNGAVPLLEKLSGDNQVAGSGALLASPLIVRVSNSQGQTLAHAPVTFSGWGSFSPDGDSASLVYRSLTVRSDASGLARAYYQTPLAEEVEIESILAQAQAARIR